MTINIEEDLALLLTATIDIKGMPLATPSVASQREEDYVKSLTYYIKNQPRIKKIVFVENSGYPLNRVQEVIADNPHNKEVEFISLNCNDFPRKFGKGYGECLLMENGIAVSKLLQKVNYIAKITGRIYLLNLTKILETVQQPYDLLCDVKEIGWRYKRWRGELSASSHCDTRFLVFSKIFYNCYLKTIHQEHQQGGFSIEAEVYRLVQQAKSQTKVIDRFLVEPEFYGIAGHFKGKNYGSQTERAKSKMRSLLRTVAPWFHL